MDDKDGCYLRTPRKNNEHQKKAEVNDINDLINLCLILDVVDIVT